MVSTSRQHMLTIIVERNAADESTISLDGFSVSGVHIHLHGTIVEIERLYQNLKANITTTQHIQKKANAWALTSYYLW